MRDAIALAPLRRRDLVPAVIEAVLRLWRAVKIDNDFEADLSCPTDRFVEIWSGTEMWVPTSCIEVRPIADWDPNGVEACIFNFLKVTECDKTVPMRFERIITALLSKLEA